MHSVNQLGVLLAGIGATGMFLMLIWPGSVSARGGPSRLFLGFGTVVCLSASQGVCP